MHSASFVLEFLAVFFVGMAPALLGSLIFWRWPKAQISQYIGTQLISNLVSSLGAIFVVLLIVSIYPRGTEYIGFDLNNKEMIAKVILWGSITFVTIITILQYVYTRFPPTNASASGEAKIKPHIEAAFQYRTPWQRIAYLIVLSIGVVAEDLVIRGYLILFLSATVGYTFVWALLSIVLSIANHLYQGREKELVLTHFLIATLFAIVTIITRNIFAVIAGHLYFDILVVRLWWKMGEQLESEKEKLDSV